MLFPLVCTVFVTRGVRAGLLICSQSSMWNNDVRSPPHTQAALPDIEVDSVRLMYWGLLCKLASVLCYHRLTASKEVDITTSEIEDLLLYDEASLSDKAIVSILAGNKKAMNELGRTVEKRRWTHDESSKKRFKFERSRSSFSNFKPVWYYPNAPAMGCRHCGRKGHGVRQCTRSNEEVWSGLSSSEKEKVLPIKPRYNAAGQGKSAYPRK